jgi:ABC-type uncharacterized transport system substrate-binding protein
MNSIQFKKWWAIILTGALGLGLWLFIHSMNPDDHSPLYQRFIHTNHAVDVTSGTDADIFTPILNNNKKFRIGIIESGVWTGFIHYFEAMIEALTNYGWGKSQVIKSLSNAEKASIPAMIKALSDKNWSDYIEFPKTAYQTISLETRKTAVSNFVDQNQFDMIFGLGTWAGQDLKALPLDFITPCIIMAVSNPIRSEILKSPKDSGKANFTGRIDTGRFQNQIKFFHDSLRFKNLGVVYSGEDDSAREYAAIPDILEVRKQKTHKQKASFNLVTATNIPASGDINLINKMLMQNTKSIINQIDAFYLTLQNGINTTTLPRLVELFNAHKIPTFYMGDSSFVKKGVLMSFTVDYQSIGDFNARKIIKILKGAKPQSLEMIFEVKPRIAINLATANIIGYNPSVKTLKIVDEIYTSINP